MNDTRFNDMTRRLSHAVNRRTFLGGAAATAGFILMNGTTGAQSSGSDASGVVEQFYQFLDAYQYDEAYALLGSDLQAAQTPKAFEEGYADTAFVQLDIQGVAAGANGTQDVSVDLSAWHNGGATHAFQGTYSVGDEGGKTLILAANIKELQTFAPLTPLCVIDDLAFEIGPWDAGAGSRMSSVIATNTSDAECVLGGSPRLTLTAANGDELVSTSEVGSPPVGIHVKPSATAQASIRFSNWCESTDLDGVTLGVEVAGDDSDGTVDFTENGISFPPCNGEGQASLIGVQGWTAP